MYVTLSISNNNIKVLSIKGKQVEKWGNLALTNGLVRDGQILQPQAVAEVIITLFRSTGVPKERVTASLSGLSFTYRFLNLPGMKPAMLDEAILRAARKEISLSLDELYITWQVLPGEGEERPYFLLGVPKVPVDAFEETLKIAGVMPYLMDLQPLALARATDRRDAIIVSMGPDCFDIVFITGGIPSVIHTITPRSEGATLEDNIKRLADELTKTVAFYQNRHPESPLGPATPLLLTGDLALELPASGLLQAETEYPVEPLVPAVECPPELPVAAYTVNIGLSLKKAPHRRATSGEGSRFHDININILSGKHRKIRAKRRPLRLWIFGAIIVAAVIALFPLYQARSHLIEENNQQLTEFSNMSRELNLGKIFAEENSQTESTIQEIIASDQALQAANRDLLSTRGDFTRDLRVVTEALPPATEFTSMEINGQQAKVYGETDSVFAVIDYATALEATGVFPEVRITELDEATPVGNEADATGSVPADTSKIKFGIVISK
jgi:Tfp pilus assembly protein PilN